MTAPTATYRVQLSDHFTLADAGQLWGYLRRLGVTGLYLSPILQANSGSDHGYDVVDPTCVDASRGGAQSLQALAEQVHADGGQLIIDVVPNHVGVGVPAETRGGGMCSPMARPRATRDFSTLTGRPATTGWLFRCSGRAPHKTRAPNATGCACAKALRRPGPGQTKA